MCIRDRTEAPPHIGVDGLVSFISVGSQCVALLVVSADVRTFRRNFHQLAPTHTILIMYYANVVVVVKSF